MEFVVKIRTDLSLNRLVELAREGHSVMKTPHVGNHYLSNLIIASLRAVHMLVIDHTLGAKDRNFHPHTVIVGGKQRPVCEPNIMMTHARVTRTPAIGNGWFRQGSKVADCHLAALRQVFPETSFLLDTDFVREHEELYRYILETVSSHGLMSELFSKGFFWKRWVCGDGTIKPMLWPPPSWDAVKGNVYALDLTDQGWLIPNFFNVLASGVSQAVDSGMSEVYHLSGPDMVRYIGTMTDLLDRAYRVLWERGEQALPPQLIFNLVPVADVRFATLASQQSALNDLVTALVALLEDPRLRGERVKAVPREERYEVIREVTARTNRLRDELKEAAKACPEVLYDIYHPPYLSQYDVVASGSPLYVHPWTLEAPIEEVGRGYRTIAQILG